MQTIQQKLNYEHKKEHIGIDMIYLCLFHLHLKSPSFELVDGEQFKLERLIQRESNPSITLSQWWMKNQIYNKR